MLATLVGLLGMIVVHIGIGFQKLGVARAQRSIFFAGLGVTFAGSLTNLWALALGLGSSSLSVFAGLGLLALVVFARFYLSESVGRAEAGALALILTGTLVSAWPQSPALVTKSESGMISLSLVMLVLGGIALWNERGLDRPWRELLYGTLAGFFGGLSINAQKAMTEAGWSLEAAGPVALYALLSVGAFSSLNLAFRHERAVVLVPLGAACSMIAATSFGVLAQAEPLNAITLTATAFAASGVGLMAWRGRQLTASASPVVDAENPA